MAKFSPLILTNRLSVLKDTDYVAGAGDVYYGATRFETGQTRAYLNQALTDQNGRVTFNMTTTGLSSGVALFSVVHSITATGMYSGSDATKAPLFYVEQLSADRKLLTLRCLQQTSVLGLISIGFGGANIPMFLDVRGLP